MPDVKKVKISVPLKFILTAYVFFSLFSCRVEVTKRLYSGGYYIDFAWKISEAKKHPKKKSAFVSSKTISSKNTIGPDSFHFAAIQNFPDKKKILASENRKEYIKFHPPSHSQPYLLILSHWNVEKTTPHENKKEEPLSVFAMVSFFLGILSIILSVVAYSAFANAVAFFPLLGIASLVGLFVFLFAIIAFWDIGKHKKGGRGFAIAGIASGCLSYFIIIIVLFLAFYFFLFGGIH